MHEDVAGDLLARGHQHSRPENGVELQDVLADELVVRRVAQAATAGNHDGCLVESRAGLLFDVAIDDLRRARGAGVAGWTKDGCLLIGTRFAETSQVHRVCQPVGMREQLTFYPEPVGGFSPTPAKAAQQKLELVAQALFLLAPAAFVVLAYSFIVALIIGKALDLTLGFRVSEDDEIAGVDRIEHAETAYELSETGAGGKFAGLSAASAAKAEKEMEMKA